MYRTDKQFMKNPATAGSRIYIGGIPNTVVSDDLEIKFRQHGKILGLVLQKGFAFIQFENDEQAKTAIRMEHAALMHGKKINVKPALADRAKGQPQRQQMQHQPPQKFQQPPQQNVQQTPKPAQPPPAPSVDIKKSPPQEEPQKEVEPEKEQEQPPEEEEEMEEPPAPSLSQNEDPPEKVPPKNTTMQSPEHPPFEEDKFEKNVTNVERDKSFNKGRGGGRGGRGGRERFNQFDGPQVNKHRGGPPRGPSGPPVTSGPPGIGHRGGMADMPPFYGKESFRPKFGAPPASLLDRPERNDCEIIVVSKALTEYAEYIEQQLKSLGLLVDLLFPNEDVPLGKVLANISSRGCLYAILVMPLNEENRSLTLNVLHGIPQEHRNMPLEDALVLITRNFDAYMRGEKIKPEKSGEVAMSLTDKHPSHIQILLNMLAENRNITSVQYDKLMSYLQERRELQHQYEVNEGVEVCSEGSGSKQTELQNRIMNILNKSASGGEVTSVLSPEQPPKANEPGPTPLLKDPSVQKALDSLMLGDMFKTMSAAI